MFAEPSRSRMTNPLLGNGLLQILGISRRTTTRVVVSLISKIIKIEILSKTTGKGGAFKQVLVSFE